MAVKPVSLKPVTESTTPQEPKAPVNKLALSLSPDADSIRIQPVGDMFTALTRESAAGKTIILAQGSGNFPLSADKALVLHMSNPDGSTSPFVVTGFSGVVYGKPVATD